MDIAERTLLMTRMNGQLFQENIPLQAVKAEAYQLKQLQGRWYISPEGTQRITYTLNEDTRTHMTADFIEVLGALLKEARPMFGFWDSTEEETPLLFDDEYEEAYRRCGTLLLPFCNRYGLFNVLTDRVDFYTSQTDNNGITRPVSTITKVGVRENWAIKANLAALEINDGFPRGIQDYSRVAYPFFPTLDDKSFPCFLLDSQKEDFHRHYSEPVETILKNPRFYALLRHLNNRKVEEDLLQDEKRPPLYVKNLNFEIIPNGDFWEMNTLPVTTIELLNVLYVANLLSRGTRTAMCHHPRCNTVFVTDNLTQRYCSPKHAASALKWRYRLKKKDEENGQKTRE